MGRTLKDDMAADALATFLNVDEWAEYIVYRPVDGRPRQIKAIVDRHPPESPDGAGGIVTPFAIIDVADDQIQGIAASLLDRGGDLVDIPLRDGSTDFDTRPINRLLMASNGMLKLEIR